MALLLDAGALYAQADRAHPHHAEVAEVLQAEQGLLIASAIGVAEADYLILTRLGINVELAFLEDLAEGTFQVECLNRAEFGTALQVARRYRDLKLRLADASLVVLAERFKIAGWSPSTNAPSAPLHPCRAARSHSCPPTAELCLSALFFRLCANRKVDGPTHLSPLFGFGIMTFFPSFVSMWRPAV